MLYPFSSFRGSQLELNYGRKNLMSPVRDNSRDKSSSWIPIHVRCHEVFFVTHTLHVVHIKEFQSAIQIVQTSQHYEVSLWSPEQMIRCFLLCCFCGIVSCTV